MLKELDTSDDPVILHIVKNTDLVQKFLDENLGKFEIDGLCKFALITLITRPE